MHFIKILFIIGVFTLSANQVFALTYKDALPISSDYKAVSQNNISAAELLQDYVESYKRKTNALLDSYNSENTQIMDAVNIRLRQMSRSLSAIQHKNVNPAVVEEIMQSIVTDLKIINQTMKTYLADEKKLHERRLQKVKDKYQATGLKISRILDDLIKTLSENLVQKQSLSQNEREIVRSLIILRQQNDKIKDFKNHSFKSESEMKDYFKDAILTIKREIQKMKNINS